MNGRLMRGFVSVVSLSKQKKNVPQVKSQALKEAEPQVLKSVSTTQHQTATVGTTDQVS